MLLRNIFKYDPKNNKYIKNKLSQKKKSCCKNEKENWLAYLNMMTGG